MFIFLATIVREDGAAQVIPTINMTTLLCKLEEIVSLPPMVQDRVGMSIGIGLLFVYFPLKVQFTPELSSASMTCTLWTYSEPSYARSFLRLTNPELSPSLMTPGMLEPPKHRVY